MRIINRSTPRFQFFISSIFFLLSVFMLNAQNLTPMQEKLQTHKSFFNSAEVKRPLSPVNVPLNQRNEINRALDVDKATILSPDFEDISGMLDRGSERLALAIPFKDNSSLELHLVKAKVFSDEFQVYAASDRSKPFPYEHGNHYWGIVKDHPNSLVAISFYKDEIAGVINYDGKFYDLGKLENSNNGQHIIYENKDLKKQFELDCSIVEPEGNSSRTFNAESSSNASAASGDCLKMYLETDYSMYQHYGSVASVTNYVTGAFSQVILLYANESINMVINELVVWDVVDPYPGTNTGDILTQFRTTLNGNYNGDLGHLIIKSSEVSGGRAYVDVICSSTYGVGVSGINTSYNNVPTYSWTVMVLAHEIGHNLGSPHTHSCSWNGNGTVIDDCGNVYYMTNNRDDNNDGIVDNLADAQYFAPCFDNVNNMIPANGGTIMSYCHLNSVGINLSLGFGTQPGNLIRNNVANASCLSSCGPLSVSITSSSDVSCGGSNDGSATALATGGSGSYSYLWSNGATSATVSNLAAGTYTVTVDDGSNTVNDSVTIADNNNTYYADSDGDGFGDANASILDCSQPANYVTDNTDCNDSNNTVYPGAPELCDGLDNDCANGIDDGLTFNTYYADSDSDGYGDASVTTSACAAPSGYVSDNTDCDDSNPGVNPGAAEICDNLDNNCNLSVDEGLPTNTYYADTDGDGYGDPLNTIEACAAPSEYTSDNSDCDDSNSAIYPGGTCNDGESCTDNDVYDADCNCAGTPTGDSDGDGVCDANDVCDGGDDTKDTDNDGFPDDCDCNTASTNFPGNSLSHSGGGSSFNSVSFATESRDPSFTISEISQRINGKPANRFIELLTVTYVDGNGATQSYGSISGANTNSETITISGFVQSISIQLEDDFDGNTNANMNVSISSVSYCAKWTDPGCDDSDGDGVCDEDDACPGIDDALIGTSCNDGDACTESDVYDSNCNCAGIFADDDGDGVCNADDICPAGDDNVDTDGDGIPDACDSSSCINELTSQFPANPLTHSGGGTSTTMVNFPGGNSDVSFSISDIGQKTNGKRTTRYIERVVVTYVNGLGNNQTYGTFSGSGSANVDIAGEVQSVTLQLDDAYSGSNGSVALSVSMSDVTSCMDSGAGPAGLDPSNGGALNYVKLYPNPAKDKVFIKLEAQVSEMNISLYDVTGKTLRSYRFSNSRSVELNVSQLASGNIYFVGVEIPGRAQEIHKLILIE